MSLSNYPPGVTGTEWQIAGADRELTEHRVCDGDTEWIAVSAMQRLLNNYTARLSSMLAGGADPLVGLMEWLDGQIRVSDIITAECNWEGEVDVAIYQGVGVWTCPRCGTEHEYDYASEQDEAVLEERSERNRDWLRD